MKKDLLGKLAKEIQKGEACVMPTDTLYGLVATARSVRSVERVYEIKGRKKGKPFVILIGSIKDLKEFGVKPDRTTEAFLRAAWPGAVSVLLACPQKKWEYLHRGTKELAFRVPDTKWLVDLLNRTGPLVAPSANPAGRAPAGSILEARAYFGRNVSYYLSAGKRVAGEPSTLVRPGERGVSVLRQGRVKIAK